jgi:hypothetical protein
VLSFLDPNEATRYRQLVIRCKIGDVTWILGSNNSAEIPSLMPALQTRTRQPLIAERSAAQAQSSLGRPQPKQPPHFPQARFSSAWLILASLVTTAFSATQMGLEPAQTPKQMNGRGNSAVSHQRPPWKSVTTI